MIKGSHQSLEAIEKIRLAGIGRKHSVEAKLKISKSHRLENLSMQTRLNKSNSKKGNKNPMFGKPLSTEHRRKISEEHILNREKRKNWKGGIATEKQRKAAAQRHREAIKFGNGGNHSLGEWETLKAQYNWSCPACNKQEPEIKLTEDHIIPISKGGSDNIENIQPLCRSCNSKKNTNIIKYVKKLHKVECPKCPWNGKSIFK